VLQELKGFLVQMGTQVLLVPIQGLKGQKELKGFKEVQVL
jgi:hypothetical protein